LDAISKTNLQSNTDRFSECPAGSGFYARIVLSYKSVRIKSDPLRRADGVSRCNQMTL
jgi:hypothetical protein